MSKLCVKFNLWQAGTAMIHNKQSFSRAHKQSFLLSEKRARARIRKRKFVRSNEFALAKSAHKSAHNFLSTGESLPKFQQISKLPTMALFDKIKHRICPEFMDNDTVTKAYTIHGNYFIEKGSTGKFHCQKSDLVTFLT